MGKKKSLGEKFHKEFVEGKTLREEGTVLVKKLINSKMFINNVIFRQKSEQDLRRQEESTRKEGEGMRKRGGENFAPKFPRSEGKVRNPLCLWPQSQQI